MSSSGGSAPPPPDPVATAQAQGAMNEQTARTQAALNRVNQYTPQGSLVYSTSGAGEDWLNQQVEAARKSYQPSNVLDTFDEAATRSKLAAENPYRDSYTATTTLSPEQQRLYDLSTSAQETYGRAANSQLQQVEGALSTPFQFNGPEMAYRPDFTGIGDPNQSREAVQAALLGRMQPSLDAERSGLEARLVNQGLTPGSEAWNTSMRDYAQRANDAQYGAILNAGQEQSRIFGLGFGQAGLNNSARQQSLQEQLALRAQPINEASALLTGQQLQMPQFGNVPQVALQAPDYQGAVGQQYAGQYSAYNADQQRTGQNNAAMGSAAASLAAAGVIAF